MLETPPFGYSYFGPLIWRLQMYRQALPDCNRNFTKTATRRMNTGKFGMKFSHRNDLEKKCVWKKHAFWAILPPLSALHYQPFNHPLPCNKE